MPTAVQCRLKAIKIGDFGIPGFDPDVTEYTVYVPYVYHENDFDTIAVPKAEVWTEDSGAQYDVTYPDTADGGVITVTVANGENVKSYNFTLEPVGKNYYLNGNMEEEKYWTYHGQGASGMSYTDDAAVGNRAVNLSVNNTYTLPLKQDNGASGLACTASKPTVSGYDYLFTALCKVSEGCYIYSGDWSCDNKTIKHYKVTDDNIASENSGGSKRDGTDALLQRNKRPVSAHNKHNARKR